METTYKRKYQYENKTSFRTRNLAIRFYLQGYGTEPIGKAIGVTATTIEYHLMKAQVYEKGRYPTIRGIPPITLKAPRRALSYKSIKRLTREDTDEFYFDEYNEKYRKPKSYAQLLSEQIMRQIIPRSNKGGLYNYENYKTMIKITIPYANQTKSQSMFCGGD